MKSDARYFPRLPRKVLSPAGIGLLVVSAALTGCGGTDHTTASVNSAMVNAPASCQSTAAVADVTGYPVFQVDSRSVDMCSVIAHYNAGYAIVADAEIDPWSPADQAPTFAALDGVQAVDPASDSLVINSVPASSAPRASGGDAATQRYVLARSTDDSNAPTECTYAGSTDQLDAQVADCLATLRAAQTSGAAVTAVATAKSQLRSVAKDAQVPGFALPDPNAWTLIGSSRQTLQLNTRTNTYFADQSTGNVTLNLSVFRLNSYLNDDYYLVRAVWAANPRVKGPCDSNYCGFFNNDHTLAFDLTVLRNDSSVAGIIEGSWPSTLIRNKSRSEKVGAGLKVGDKGPEASVSSEVATSYSYSAVNIINSSSNGQLKFSLSHATSVGFSFGGDLFDADPTTVDGVQMTAWGLFRIPNDGSPQARPDDVRVTVNEMSGNFGFFQRAGALPMAVLFNSASLYGYRNDKPYTITASPPVFDVRLLANNGTYQSIDTENPTPLLLKPGQSTTIDVYAGDASTPYRLGWQLVDAPSWLVTSAGKGSRYAGYKRVTVKASDNATVGSTDYIRFNTMPAAAAPSTRGGPLEIPVTIVN
ncbi:hypothetical protein [Caballeronia sp. LZ034LL]|uniref:hypothetical protein n=1 Tax=Caballeronia sp. LZ034LL TaxID=3038567 RepID=UPI0028576E8E|nr:hypothetical protein [Caballeronia sp. LZ034LL]MDR5835956.1 hypothetical protein [Caballeronia sp. LZ034LL]